MVLCPFSVRPMLHREGEVVLGCREIDSESNDGVSKLEGL